MPVQYNAYGRYGHESEDRMQRITMYHHVSPCITISDIARMAGLSKATVSRALNQEPAVDSATRKRILALMHDRGYQTAQGAIVLANGGSVKRRWVRDSDAIFCGG